LLLDLQDALTVAKRQVDKSATNATALLDQRHQPQPKRPGFFARVFGAETITFYSVIPTDELKKLRQQLAAVADGYAMSLRRLESAMPQFSLFAISCEGQPFDPELMEVVDTVSGTDKTVGTVIEVMRVGYRWHGKLLRYAQVKVAK
jgi:molecular chaperone GrpE